jgi:hypothetical protein
MPTPDKSMVQRVLARDDRDQICRKAIEIGWQAVLDQPDRAWWRRRTTSADVMWENTVKAAVDLFEGQPGVTTIPHHDTMSFIFDDTVLARFKLADVSLMTKNYPTPLANLFDHHEEDLFGFEGHHRVELVHVPNRFRTGLEWVGVVARERGKQLWNFELPGGGAAVVDLPTPTPPKPAPAADRILRLIKPEGEDRVEKEGE